jgi:hypothetical protein
MPSMKGSEKRVVIYQDKNGILFIHSSTKVSDRKYKIKTSLVGYADIKKSSNDELAEKIKNALNNCD